MSLKAFHILFIVVSTLLTLGLGVWGFQQYWSGVGAGTELALGVSGLALTAGLLWYGKYALRKLKHISYL